MKKIIFGFLFAGIFNLAFAASGDLPANTVQGQSNALYSKYDIKRSWKCRFLRVSQCGNPSSFNNYVNKGCINDINKEDPCIVNFCLKNCATAPNCPSGELEGLCQQHCQNVAFPNQAAQNRLNQCVQGSLNTEGAASKTAGRSYDKAYLQNLERQRRGGLKEAQKVLDLVNKLSKQRQTLFYVDGASLSKAGIVRIDDFVKNVEQAIQLTQKMDQAVNSLAISGQAPEIVTQARALIAKSDQQVQFFIRIVQRLNQEAITLMQVVQQASSAGSVQLRSSLPSYSSRPPSRPVSQTFPRLVSTASNDSEWGETDQQAQSE